MKKLFKYILLLLSFSFVFYSCTEDFIPVFKENTTERFLSARSKYDTILKSSKNGWLLQYFPGKDLKYGGFNYYIKFLEGNKMEVRTELYKSAKEGEESSYAIKQYGGAILSFDLYNSLMHFFATPSTDEYKGKGGDFEFQIISYKDDVMTLQGIKTGNYMKLVKLKETPEEYNKKAEQMENKISSFSLFYGKIGDKPIKAGKVGRQLNFSYEEDEKQVSKIISYIYTDKGVYLYTPLVIDGESYQEFNLNEPNQNSLISKNKQLKIRGVVPPINFDKTLWSLDISIAENRSSKVRDIWDIAYKADNNKYGESLSSEILIGNYRDETSIHFYSLDKKRNKNYRVSYQLMFKPAYENEDYIYILKNNAGINWKWYKTFFIDMVSMLTDNGPFSVKLDNKDNPTKATLKSINNPDIWFILNKK